MDVVMHLSESPTRIAAAAGRALSAGFVDLAFRSSVSEIGIR